MRWWGECRCVGAEEKGRREEVRMRKSKQVRVCNTSHCEVEKKSNIGKHTESWLTKLDH